MKNLLTGEKIPSRAQISLNGIGQKAYLYGILKAMKFYHAHSNHEFSLEAFLKFTPRVSQDKATRFWKKNNTLQFNW